MELKYESQKHFYPPPYKRGYSRIIAIVLALLIVIAGGSGFAFVSHNAQQSHAAGVIYKDLPNGAPKQGILIDDISKFWTIPHEFYTTNPNLKEIDIWNETAKAVIYDGVTNNTQIIPGYYTLVWKEIAIDQDGDPVDIIMKVDNMRGYGNDSPYFTYVYCDGGISAYAFSYRDGTTRAWFDIQFFFYKSEPDNSTGINDKVQNPLDNLNNRTPANGNWVLQYTDIDVRWPDDTGWAETVVLLENYIPEVHVIPDNMYIPNSGDTSRPGCWLRNFDYNGGWAFQNSVSIWDNDTMHTGFCAIAQNGYKISWWGKQCGTKINNIYGQSQIIASKDEGGEINDEGIVEIGWKNNKTYTVTADKHHIISSITIDGKEIPITNPKEQSYTFESVTSDHTIHASFTSTRHMLVYDANAEVFTGDTPSSVHDAGTDTIIADNGFIRDGYQFIGWNTTPDGSGKAYSPNEKIFIDDEDITLYAQWKKLVTVTFMDDDGTVYGSETLPIGDSATPPQTPAKQGYTFVSWNGIYVNVEKDEVVVASWSPNRYTIIYEPNEGDGIHMLDQEMLYDEEGSIKKNEYTRHNYEFVGWNTSPDGTGTSYASGDVVKNLTDEQDGKVYLYAQWEFYIQMPETGQSGVSLVLLIGGLAMTVSIAIGMQSQIRRERTSNSSPM